MLSMSQTKLGDAVGLTFQQIQKYERGANRIGASRLFEFSKILDVPVSFFFEGMPEELLATVGNGHKRIEVSEAATGCTFHTSNICYHDLKAALRRIR